LIAVVIKEKEAVNLLKSTTTEISPPAKDITKEDDPKLEFPDLANPPADTTETSRPVTKKNNLLKSANETKEKSSPDRAIFKSIGTALKLIVSKRPVKIKSGSKKSSQFRSRRKALPPQSLSLRLRNLARNALRNFQTRFRNLPRSSQILAVASLVLVILFAGSIIIIAQKKNEINKLSQNEILLDRALKKEKEAADALIYNDKAKAKELLQEAQTEAEKLIAANILKTEAENLLEKIKGQMDEVSGITRVDNAIVIADIEKKPINTLIGLKDKVYTFDEKTNLIYNLDEESKKLIAISEESNNVGYFKLATADDTNNIIYFLTDSPSLAKFDVAKKTLENKSIDIFNKDQETKDIATYGDGLYRLIPAAKQILKHTKTIAGFSKGTEWVITGEDDLANAQSLTIDGFIYVLKADGVVNKYLRGKKQSFALAEIPEPMDSPTEIFTSENLENLYILDPQNKRVLAFNKKNGLVTAQFQADVFDKLKSIYVDPEEKKMYVLTEEKILGVVLEIKQEG